MNRAKAQAHLDRVAGGLPIQHPKQAHHPIRAFLWNDSPDLLAVTGGLGLPYRLTSRFGPPRKGQWIHYAIKRHIRLSEALLEAANNHPLRQGGIHAKKT